MSGHQRGLPPGAAVYAQPAPRRLADADDDGDDGVSPLFGGDKVLSAFDGGDRWLNVRFAGCIAGGALGGLVARNGLGLFGLVGRGRWWRHEVFGALGTVAGASYFFVSSYRRHFGATR